MTISLLGDIIWTFFIVQTVIAEGIKDEIYPGRC